MGFPRSTRTCRFSIAPSTESTSEPSSELCERSSTEQAAHSFSSAMSSAVESLMGRARVMLKLECLKDGIFGPV